MIAILLFSLLIGSSVCNLRKISSVVNPGCGSDCNNNTNVLVHVTADGPEDTLHHIWDFTYKPTFILALTPLNTSLSINWTDFQKQEIGALQFSSDPLYSFSFILDQIVEFNDLNSTAVYVPGEYNTTDFKVYKPSDFEWAFKWDKFESTTKNVFAAIEGVNSRNVNHKGSVVITLSAYGTMEHSKIQPHLLHTVNASQIDIVLDGFSSTETFKSRFALIFTMVSADSPQSSFTPIEWKSLDDEHSPGVFTIAGVKASQGYLEWRTVAYTTSERLMTSSTDVTTSLQPVTSNSSLDHTAFLSLFGRQLDKMLVKSVVLSFGQPGEAFYSATRYLSWTFLGAIGKPVDEGFSLLVLLIVSIGIGLPAILILVGSLCIVVKRISKRSQDVVFSDS